jgi:hypothetical protein
MARQKDLAMKIPTVVLVTISTLLLSSPVFAKHYHHRRSFMKHAGALKPSESSARTMPSNSPAPAKPIQ